MARSFEDNNNQPFQEVSNNKEMTCVGQTHQPKTGNPIKNTAGFRSTLMANYTNFWGEWGEGESTYFSGTSRCGKGVMKLQTSCMPCGSGAARH